MCQATTEALNHLYATLDGLKPKALPSDPTSPLFDFAKGIIDGASTVEEHTVGKVLAYASLFHKQFPEEGKQTNALVADKALQVLSHPDNKLTLHDVLTYVGGCMLLVGMALHAAKQKGILDRLPELPLPEAIKPAASVLDESA
jgi:hypothetical protein